MLGERTRDGEQRLDRTQAVPHQQNAFALPAMEKIDPALVNNPFIFPDEATLAKVKVFRALSPEEETKFSEAFAIASGL